MSSRHLLDPELAEFVEGFPIRTYSTEALPDIRAADERAILAAAQVPLPGGITERRETITAAPDGNALDLLVTLPRSASGALPAVLYIHGGGYVSGSPYQSRAAIGGLAASAGAVVVSPRYRLAPETRFPGAIEDCYSALTWIHSNAARLGIDRRRIAVIGASAGGGLAASLALMARDRGGIPLALQVLVSPMLDDRTGVTRDPGAFAGEFVWTPASNRFGWECLLGHAAGAPDVSPYAAPARVGDMSNLPAACILVGALDLFFEESLEYGRRLARAGVPVEMKVYPGAIHGFARVATARVTEAYLQDMERAFKRAFSLGGDDC